MITFNSFLGCDLYSESSRKSFAHELSIPFWDATQEIWSWHAQDVEITFNSFLGCDAVYQGFGLKVARASFNSFLGCDLKYEYELSAELLKNFQFLSGMRHFSFTITMSIQQPFNSFLGCDIGGGGGAIVGGNTFQFLSGMRLERNINVSYL